jgi:hypothetical protein
LERITLFSPQVLEMLREERSRIRENSHSSVKLCRYYPECKFRRSMEECDRYSDSSLARQRLEEALRAVGD